MIFYTSVCQAPAIKEWREAPARILTPRCAKLTSCSADSYRSKPGRLPTDAAVITSAYLKSRRSSLAYVTSRCCSTSPATPFIDLPRIEMDGNGDRNRHQYMMHVENHLRYIYLSIYLSVHHVHLVQKVHNTVPRRNSCPEFITLFHDILAGMAGART